MFDQEMAEYVRDCLQKLEKLQSDQPHRNEEYFLMQYLIEVQRACYTALVEPTQPINMQALSDQVDAFYSVVKLQILANVQHYSRFYPHLRYEIGLKEELLHHLAHTKLTKDPIIAIFYYGFLLAEQPTLQHYKDLKCLLKKHSSSVAKKDFA